MKKLDKQVWGWALYDWANSAFATTVMAGFFPIFFKQYWSYGADVNTSTAQLGFANAIASLIGEGELYEDYIIPSVFNRALVPQIADAVAQSALDTGIARRGYKQE